MPRKPTDRLSGARLNNINHVKHGLYSPRFSVKDNNELVPISADQTSAELALIGAHAFEGLLSDQAITPGGVEPHSNCSEIAVNLRIFKLNLFTLDTLQAPTCLPKHKVAFLSFRKSSSYRGRILLSKTRVLRVADAEYTSQHEDGVLPDDIVLEE